MTGRQSIWWKGFAGGAVLVMLALAWVTSAVLALERSEFEARADARRQEVVRLALWRMDSWVGPRLARESARPYFEYLSYYPQERAYTRMLTPIEEGAVLTPSPLLTFREPFIRLHFQIDAAGRLSSPQVPTSNHRDLAESTVLSSQEIVGCGIVLQRIDGLIDIQSLRAQVEHAELRLAMVPEPPPPQVVTAQKGMAEDYGKAQTAWTIIEQTKRLARNAESNEPYQIDQRQQQAPAQQMDLGSPFPQTFTAKSDTVLVGPFVPLWMHDPAGQPELFYLRQIHVGIEHHLQGFLVDWTYLRSTLIDEVADLTPNADVIPRTEAAESDGRSPQLDLASVPATFRGPPPPEADIPPLTPTRLALLIVWAVVIVAVGAGGLMLHASLLYGQRRSDFASAVTHELRTPLTTFRLYSEMLADDMVADPQRKREYLETLRSESSRLARLVENVLAYARLEEGRQRTSPKQVSAEAMLGDIVPNLSRQAADADMQLQVSNELPASQLVHADPDSVSRILTNLVDNACKYANGCTTRRINLRLTREASAVQISVRDHGPGVDSKAARTLFAPFRRGKDADRNASAGVGLGLALCRSLARDMGGDLRLDATPQESGACFTLVLPTDAGRV